MSPIASTTTGRLNAGRIQNRRVMSSSSGFGSSSAVIVRGSSAMPQIGQAPGGRCTTSRMHRAGVALTPADEATGGSGSRGLEELFRIRLESPETARLQK